MILLEARARRTFLFPAPLEETCTFFQDYELQFGLLPHIRCTRSYGAGRYRVRYHSVELGVYDVAIDCDVWADYDAERRCLSLTPLAGVRSSPPRVTLRSLTAPGSYASQSIFSPAGDFTLTDYRMTLRAELPKPVGLRLIPDQVVEHIAAEIANWRVEEISSRFAARSIEAFRTERATGSRRLRGGHAGLS